MRAFLDCKTNRRKCAVMRPTAAERDFAPLIMLTQPFMFINSMKPIICARFTRSTMARTPAFDSWRGVEGQDSMASRNSMLVLPFARSVTQAKCAGDCTPQYAAGAQRYKARRSRAASRREHRPERICTKAASIGPSALTLGADLISAPRSAVSEATIRRYIERTAATSSRSCGPTPDAGLYSLHPPDRQRGCAVSGFAGANPVKFMHSYRCAGKSRYSPGGPS